MSSTTANFPISSLSNSPRFNSYKPKSKNDSSLKNLNIVSKSQFKPQGQVAILKRPSSDSKLITDKASYKSIVLKDSKSFVSSKSKVNISEPRKNLAKASSVSKPNSSLNGGLSPGTEIVSESRSSSRSRRRFRGKPRRNSVSTQSVSNQALTIPNNQENSQGSLSDGPFPIDRPKKNLNSAKDNSLYKPDKYTPLFNQDNKNQAALNLLESLLSKSEVDSPQVVTPQPSPRLASDSSKKKVMASHLLINLLKPSPVSTATIKNVNQMPSKLYAGPLFKQAPNLSSLPLPPIMANQA